MQPIANPPPAEVSPASPYEQKLQDKEQHKLVPTTLAYDNASFIHGNTSRIIRILCEFQEPQERLRAHNIKGTILFFGSARSMDQKQYDETLSGLNKDLANLPAAGAISGDGDSEAIANKRQQINERIARFKKVEWMCPYTVVVEDLAKRLTEWSMSMPKLKKYFAAQPDYLSGVASKEVESAQPLVVCTGGGPGIMEAANRGASSVPNAMSMGMGISLPFEKGLNSFVTKSLAFEYHYFFTRKFWMMYTAKALIVGPGGFGTLDELMELLTLRQTGKLQYDVPVVLIGSKFWKTVVNWQALAEFGVISQAEVDRLCFADDVETAFDFITSSIEDNADKFKDATTTPQAANQQREGSSPTKLSL